MRPAVPALGFALLGTIISAEDPGEIILRARAEAFIGQELVILPPGGKFDKLTDDATFLAGDLFGIGDDWAITALRQPEDSRPHPCPCGRRCGYPVEAYVFYTRRAGSWMLRSLIKPELPVHPDTNPCIRVSDISGDGRPEVLLVMCTNSGGDLVKPYKLNQEAGEIESAFPGTFHVPEWDGRYVVVRDKFGGSEGFDWIGHRLVLRWRLSGDRQIWPAEVATPTTPLLIRRDFSEFDDAGHMKYSWSSIGNLPEDGYLGDQNLDKVEVMFRIGERKRTCLLNFPNIQTSDKRLSETLLQAIWKSIHREPELLTADRVVGFQDDSTIPLSDLAEVSILEGWPPGVEIPDQR